MKKERNNWSGPPVYTVIVIGSKEVLLSAASRTEYLEWKNNNKEKYEESRKEVCESAYLTHITLFAREKKIFV